MKTSPKLLKMEIVLNQIDLLSINQLCTLRGLGSRLSGTTNLKASKKSDIQIEFEGIVGEYAFCKINNLFLEVSAQPRSGSYDCITTNGSRVDIKSTAYKTGKLLGDIRRNPDIDIYVLALLDEHPHYMRVSFPGFAYSDELYDATNLTNLGSGPVYAITQDKLHKF